VTSKPQIQVVLYNWHANRVSAAAYDTLLDPLQPYFNYVLRSLDWNELCPPEWTEKSQLPVVFFYATPPIEALRASGRIVVWIPMWDTARTFTSNFWEHVPRNVRIISFCDALSERTRAAGLQTLDVRYFCDPASNTPVEWQGERVAYYWNRIGLVSPRFLERWCDILRIDRLLFKAQMDPGIPQRLAFDLPHRFGRTVVETIPHMENREDYFKLIESANIFLAPRPYEGIGMTFIEAMARGCAVFAYDGATMNEYIQSGKNGYLLRGRPSLPARTVAYGRRKLAKYGFRTPRPLFYVRDDQPWDEVARFDLARMGQAARLAHIEGYTRWQAAIPQMAQFIRESISPK
jgi:hypothetical protein